MINNIEQNVVSAADYVEHAKEATKKAVRYQSKARRVSDPATPRTSVSQEQTRLLLRFETEAVLALNSLGVVR